MYNPISTYRLQFNKDFTFSDLDTLLPYLQTLGVTTIYASPIFEATPESPHGYDGVNPNRINPEIGTHEQLRAIRQRLQQAGMGWLQDIVPNHMAYHPNNEWLMDVLEKGPLSRYTLFFETSLASSFFQGRILAPFLSQSLEETVVKQELTLAFEQARFVLKVSGNVMPLKPGSYATILQAGTDQSTETVQQLLIELDQFRHLDEPEAYAIDWDEFRQQLSALMTNSAVEQHVQQSIRHLNKNPEQLGKLAEEQHYRFCTEPETRRVMNYRRFFTVNGLICLNMRESTVLEHVHRLTGTLLREGIFQGLRVDHVDGLFDPETYLARLRELAGPEAYISVEKILQADEDIPTSWPVQGTSGYDFLALVNNLLTYSPVEPAFREFYQALIGSDTTLPERVRDRKRYFLAQYMGGELDNLYHYFLALNLTDEVQFDTLAAGELKAVIGELLVACPVYRYYGNHFPMPDEEASVVRKLLNTIREKNPDMTTAIGVLEGALLTKPPVADEDYNNRALRFYQRLMQFSGPLMAKGVEDTLMYTYNSFICHNEVGDSPERFGLSVEAFHQAMHYRQTHWPLAQNTTATHDTKRGEDVRARLNVLTDLADEWLTEVRAWQQLNADLKQTDSPGVDSPDLNDEYLIYQNLLGAYPMPGETEDDFPNRFRLYLGKALQEAKRHTTGWVVEDEYHTGVRAFTDRLLDYEGPFWARFSLFHQQIADFGIVNSLAQTLLKMTCPGVPDVYQGGEGWDFSLVDPDNRRPVQFRRLRQWLADTRTHQGPNESIWPELWARRFSGQIKFYLTYRLLQERQQNASLFLKGSYFPLSIEGTYRDNLMAFARHYEAAWYIVIVPLHSARLCREQDTDVLSLDWKDTRVNLPADAPTFWTNCLTSAIGEAQEGIQIQTVLSQVPVALLRLG